MTPPKRASLCAHIMEVSYGNENAQRRPLNAQVHRLLDNNALHQRGKQT